MWYNGNDTTNDWLMHYKYVNKYMKNGKWQYVYDTGKNTVSHDVIKTDQSNNAGAKRAQRHGTVSQQSRVNNAVTNSKKSAGEQIKSGVARKANNAKMTTKYYANKGKKFLAKVTAPARAKYKDLTKVTTTTTTGKDKYGNTYTETTTGNKIHSRTTRSTVVATTPSKKKKRN